MYLLRQFISTQNSPFSIVLIRKYLFCGYIWVNAHLARSAPPPLHVYLSGHNTRIPNWSLLIVPYSDAVGCVRAGKIQCSGG